MSHLKNYVERIKCSVSLIEASLKNETPPSLKELADAAYLSKFHFHRVYRLVTGETCQQTLNRLRLAKAASDLQSCHESTTQIALAAGYSSGQAFAKALKKTVNVSASELRKEPERLADTIEFLSKPEPNIADSAALSVELVYLDELHVLAIETRNRYPELNQVYSALFEAAGGPDNVSAILGIPGDFGAYLSDKDAYFTCGLVLNDSSIVEGPSIWTTTPETKYLRLRHQGDYGKLDTSLDALYSQFIDSEHIEFADSPCLFHYLDDPEEVQEQFLRTDLYVPIA